jgi:hypothetical protein
VNLPQALDQSLGPQMRPAANPRQVEKAHKRQAIDGIEHV